MGPVSIGVEVQRNTDGDTSSTSFGAADIEVLIFPGFRAKRGTLLYLKSWAPIGTSFNPNETWHIYCGMTSLHRSNNGLLAKELVSGQQTSKY